MEAALTGEMQLAVMQGIVVLRCHRLPCWCIGFTSDQCPGVCLAGLLLWPAQ
jgi:hypothetical protein